MNGRPLLVTTIVHSGYYCHLEQAIAPEMEAVRAPSPVVAAEQAVPSPAEMAAVVVEAEEIVEEPAAPGPTLAAVASLADHSIPVAVAIAAPGHSAEWERPDPILAAVEMFAAKAAMVAAVPSPAEMAGPNHSGLKVAARLPGQVARRQARPAPCGRCGYAARCREQPAQPPPR